MFNLWCICGSECIIKSSATGFCMFMKSSTLMMALSMKRTSGTVLGEAVLVKVGEVDADTSANGRFWNIGFVESIFRFVLMRFGMFFNDIELAGVLGERRGLKVEEPGGIPTSLRHEAYHGTCPDDSAIGESDVILIAAQGSPQEAAISPFCIQFGTKSPRHKP